MEIKKKLNVNFLIGTLLSDMKIRKITLNYIQYMLLRVLNL